MKSSDVNAVLAGTIGGATAAYLALTTTLNWPAAIAAGMLVVIILYGYMEYHS